MTIANKAVSGRSEADLTSESFNRLLAWLDRDREAAGWRYEEIRSRLIKVFVCRGCSIAEDLADQTINRVARRVPEIETTYVGNPALYFYGVAQKIFLEYARKEPIPALLPLPSPTTDDSEIRYECLERCMDGLPVQNRELILAYYESEEGSKIASRKDLAGQRRIGANALWIRAHRIRESLRNCVNQCVRQKLAKVVSSESAITRRSEDNPHD